MLTSWSGVVNLFQTATHQFFWTAVNPSIKELANTCFLYWYPEVKGCVCMSVSIVSRLTELGFHTRATGKQEKKPRLELDLVTHGQPLPLALSCRYERNKPAKVQCVRPYMHLCQRLCKRAFLHVCLHQGSVGQNVRKLKESVWQSGVK